MPIVRLPNGDLRDEIRQPLYDTLSLAVASGTGIVGAAANDLNNQQFFSDIQGKQKWQSNLRQNSLLEVAVSFRVQGFALDGQYVNTGAGFLNPKTAMLPSIQDYGSLRVHIGEKDYWEGPLAYIMGRIEQNAAVSTLTGTTQAAAAANATTGLVYQRAGQVAVQGVILSGRHVVDINPLQSFYAQIQMSVPAGLAAATTVEGNDVVNLKFSFKGLQRRPVQ